MLLEWSELQGHSQASLRRITESDMHLFDIHLKCAVSPVCVFLTNAVRSHHACGLECGGFIYLKYEPHKQKAALISNADARLIV